MKCTKYITVDCDGKYAKLTSKRTSVKPYEVCFPLTIEIHDSYFERPTLSAKVTFPERETLIEDVDIEGVREAILETTGINLSISLEEIKEPIL